MVGFSALIQLNEVLALELLRAIISEFDSIEIKTMVNSFLVEFASPLEVVRCALSDGPQSLVPNQFSQLIEELDLMCTVLGRKLTQ